MATKDKERITSAEFETRIAAIDKHQKELVREIEKHWNNIAAAEIEAEDCRNSGDMEGYWAAQREIDENTLDIAEKERTIGECKTQRLMLPGEID